MAGMPVKDVLKYFPGHEGGDGALEILLVSSSQEYLDELQKSLYVTRQIHSDKRVYKLRVHTCKQIEDILSVTSGEFTIDFIVFILDGNNMKCFMEQVRNNLNLLDLTFRREKMCLVNPNPGFNNSTIKPLDVWNFAHHSQINLINGKIRDPEKLIHLSKRILNLVEASCGVLNPVPLLGYV